MKEPSRDRVKKLLWDTVSLYIRKRDKATCFTCGKRVWNEELGEFTVKGFNAGHFIHNVLDDDEMNLHCQCVRCNKYLQGNLGEYGVRMIEKYGLEEVGELYIRAKKALGGDLRTVSELQDRIQYFKEKTRNLPVF